MCLIHTRKIGRVAILCCAFLPSANEVGGVAIAGKRCETAVRSKVDVFQQANFLGRSVSPRYAWIGIHREEQYTAQYGASTTQPHCLVERAAAMATLAMVELRKIVFKCILIR